MAGSHQGGQADGVKTHIRLACKPPVASTKTIMGKCNVKHVLFLRADNPRRRCAPMQGVAGRALEAVGIEFIKQYDGQEQVLGCAKLTHVYTRIPKHAAFAPLLCPPC